MKKELLALSLVALTITFQSCSKDEEDPKQTLTIPSVYESADFSANTTKEAELKNQIKTLADYMKTGQDSTVKLTLTQLNTLFEANSPNSLKAASGTYISSFIQNTLFPDLVTHSGQAFNPLSAPSSKGGAFGGRLWDGRGYEILQGVEKGFYTGLIIHQVAELSKGEITNATIDRMLAIYGAHPTFPNTPTAGKADHPDSYLALYTSRRDKNDGKGLYSEIKTDFLTIKAAAANKDLYRNELNAALTELCHDLEKAMVATVINYTHGAITKLSKTNPTEADIAGGLHDLGEAIGFIHGFKAIDASKRKITDAQVDEVLALFNYADPANHTVYTFVTDAANQLPKLVQIQGIFKNLYNFSTQDIDDFKQNWVTVQGR